MRILISLIFVIFSLFSFSQVPGAGKLPVQKNKQDTSVMPLQIPDSVNTISVSDIQKTLSLLEDKITKKDYDQAVIFYRFLLEVTADKRKSKLLKQ